MRSFGVFWADFLTHLCAFCGFLATLLFALVLSCTILTKGWKQTHFKITKRSSMSDKISLQIASLAKTTPQTHWQIITLPRNEEKTPTLLITLQKKREVFNQVFSKLAFSRCLAEFTLTKTQAAQCP